MFEDIREVVCPKWSLEILQLLAEDGPCNYSMVEAELNTSSDVVTERLQTLVEYELLDRDEQSARNVRYSVTERGEEILERATRIDDYLEDQ